MKLDIDEDGWVVSDDVSIERSPNSSSRLGAKIDWITLHYTAGTSGNGAIKWLQNPQASASAHFVENRGRLYQLVSLRNRAWHVGKGQFPSNGTVFKSRCDRSAIGIEITNAGRLDKEDDGSFTYQVGRVDKPYDVKLGIPVRHSLTFRSGPVVSDWWAPYSDQTIEALASLCAGLVDRYKIDVNRIVGHESAATPYGRKTDPGPLFPWVEFYRKVHDKLGRPLPPIAELMKYHRVVWE